MEDVNKKLDKLDNHMEAIKHLLTNLNDTLEVTTKKIETMERKIDNLSEKIDGEVLEECKKMGGHIDFVEEVYDNVKHPLGYICKKIGYLMYNQFLSNYDSYVESIFSEFKSISQLAHITILSAIIALVFDLLFLPYLLKRYIK